MKGKVVDMFSRKDMQDHGQDTESNDKRTGDYGMFVGAISISEADDIRQRMGELNGRIKQIEAMMKTWRKDYGELSEDLYDMIIAMGIKPHEFNPLKHDIMVSEEGKVWIVDLPKHTN